MRITWPALSISPCHRLWLHDHRDRGVKRVDEERDLLQPRVNRCLLVAAPGEFEGNT